MPRNTNSITEEILVSFSVFCASDALPDCKQKQKRARMEAWLLSSLRHLRLFEDLFGDHRQNGTPLHTYANNLITSPIQYFREGGTSDEAKKSFFTPSFRGALILC